MSLKPFGQRGSVDPARLSAMPRPMQREAILLLREMGENLLVVAQKSGMNSMDLARIAGETAPLHSLAKDWQS